MPLIEIVTEPDFRHAKHAAAFFGYLRELLVAIGVNDGNMEEGSLRCDANVSVRPVGAATLGTKAEIKNLNSFRFLEDAIAHEVAAADRRDRGRRTRRAGDAPVGSVEQAHDRRCAAKRKRTTTGISRSPICRRSWSTREREEAIRAVHARAARRAAQSTQGGAPAPAAGRPPADGSGAGGTSKTSSGRARPPSRREPGIMGVVARQDERANTDDIAIIEERVPAASELAGLLALVEPPATSAARSRRTSSRRCSHRGARADEIVESEGLTQIDDESQIVGLIADVLAANADAVDAVSRRQDRRRSASSSVRS